jgi:hypothetical protein
MTARQKHEMEPTNVVPFAKHGRGPIAPQLKRFLDECVIPILIRRTLAELSLESSVRRASHSNCGGDSAKAGAR